jgi:hypothetical protein
MILRSQTMNETLWIGTNGGGLGHLSKDEITWFTKTNSGLPRDYISHVEVGLDGRIRFSGCAHDLGGLVVYDGKKFEIFTPDNSVLNQNVFARDLTYQTKSPENQYPGLAYLINFFVICLPGT